MSLKTFKILFIIADPKTEADVSQKLSDVRAVVFEIATVGTLAEALALLHRDSFDVLLASLAVPDYRGIESLRELILAATEAPVIVVSSAYDEAQALEAVRAGAEDYTVGSRMNSAAFERVILYSIERHMAHQRTALQFSVGTTKSVKQGDRRPAGCGDCTRNQYADPVHRGQHPFRAGPPKLPRSLARRADPLSLRLLCHDMYIHSRRFAQETIYPIHVQQFFPALGRRPAKNHLRNVLFPYEICRSHRDAFAF
jgi:DNA-binding NarL/FixJ family response regulator